MLEAESLSSGPDGKGAAQKAKTRQGDAKLSKTVEGSSGGMSNCWEGNNISPVQQTCCLSEQEQSLACTGNSASRTPLISLQCFTYCHQAF